MEASAGGLGSVSCVTVFPAPSFAARPSLPAFPRRASRAGSASWVWPRPGRLRRQQAPDASGGEPGHGGAAAEQEEAAASDGDSLVRSRPPSTSRRARPRFPARRPGPAPPQVPRRGRRPAARSSSSLTAEPARRATTMVTTVGTVPTNGSARAAAMAMTATTATPRTASDGRADGEVAEEDRQYYGADEHRHDERRYVGRAKELDALGYQGAGRQLHYSLGQRHEDRGHRGIESVHELRDPERDHGPDHAGDTRPRPADLVCLPMLVLSNTSRFEMLSLESIPRAIDSAPEILTSTLRMRLPARINRT